MQIFELAFRLGIIIAIFSFIWGIIRLALGLLRGGSVQSIYESYFLKSAKYIFLSNVIVLNDFDKDNQTLMTQELVFTVFILLMYFIGNMQKKQQRHLLMKSLPSNFPFAIPIYHTTGEIISILLGIGAFVFFATFPNYAIYGVSEWFYNGVISLENTFLIGFIFKVVGFFFLVGILRNTLNSISMAITRKPLFESNTSFYSNFENRNRKEKDNEKEKDEFDDYEEIK